MAASAARSTYDGGVVLEKMGATKGTLANGGGAVADVEHHELFLS
jgi:hypothetical protein